MVSQSWFRYLWPTHHHHHHASSSSSSPAIAVLAFEVASLMSKILHLWQSLSDKHIIRLRQDITNSVGISKLVSDDDNRIVSLVSAELMDNMAHIARAVARLATNCNDPSLNKFQHIFNHFINTGFDPNGWAFSWSKMEAKTKKMHKFISLNANLHQQIEILTDLEHTLKRMKTSNNDADAITLVAFEKKVARKKQDVNRIKDISLWNKTYDETVLLLARSLFTLFARIKHVFDIDDHDMTLQPESGEGISGSGFVNSAHKLRSNPSLSMLLQSSDHRRSQNDFSRFSSGSLAKPSITMSGPMPRTTVNTGNFYSGPLGSSATKSGRESVTNKRGVGFYSGPLGKQNTKYSSPLSGTSKAIQRLWQKRDNPSGVRQGKNLHTTHNGLATSGGSGTESRISSPFTTEVHSGILGRDNTGELAYSDVRFGKLSLFSPKRRLLNAPTDTLGGAALALHYANVIIVIEKLVASPHLIGHDARDDLYNMLPARVKAALRERLKPYAKSLSASVYDTGLAGEWSEAMAGILEWLAPLAHNMIRWQSERGFEQTNVVSRTHVLLVQTLYFANQEKTEAIITELLVGLNYVWRFGREVNAKALLECPSSKIFDESLDLEG